MTKHYKEVKAKADFVEIEKEVLKFWDEDKTFEKPFTTATVPPNSFFTTALRLPTVRRTTDILWFLTLKTLSPVIRR